MNEWMNEWMIAFVALYVVAVKALVELNTIAALTTDKWRKV